MYVNSLPKSPNGMRFPSHPFRIAHRPYIVQPFLIAPVIPGDSLKGMQIKGRALTKSSTLDPFCGMYLEHKVCYVRLTDFDFSPTQYPDGANPFEFGDVNREKLAAMLVDTTNAKAADLDYLGATDAPLYTAKGTVPFVERCLQRVVQDYLRLPGENWDAFTATQGGRELPIAPIRNQDWLDSAADYATLPEGADVDVDLNADSTITASEIETAINQYHALLAQGNVEISYDEYLRAKFGQRLPKSRVPMSEELMHRTLWQAPSNTVNPADGTVQTAISWQVEHSMKTPKIFREPGFIFGVTYLRRKEYRNPANVAGTAVGTMWRTAAWLSDALMGGPAYSMERLTMAEEGTDLLPPTKESSVGAGDGVDVIFDYKDLYTKGDQFVYDPSSTTEPYAAMPNDDMIKRYHADSIVEALPYCVQDGVVMMQISSAVSDTSDPVQDLP